MGILTDSNSVVNILLQHGFEKREKSVTGELHDCYEKVINLPKYSYDAWIAVNTQSSDVVIYIEYDCGGEISTIRDTLNNGFNNQSAFFGELDECVTNWLKLYI